MKVIAISGKAQHGKDSTAMILKSQLESVGYTVLIAHFADLLKYICRQFFCWNGEKDETGRHMLQYVGTDVIREKEPDLWVNFIVLILEMFPTQWDYVLLPDCRFPNEVERLESAGLNTTHIRVIRKGFESPLSEEQRIHPSETAMDSIVPDYYILNDGTLRDLQATVSDWLVTLEESIGI